MSKKAKLTLTGVGRAVATWGTMTALATWWFIRVTAIISAILGGVSAWLYLGFIATDSAKAQVLAKGGGPMLADLIALVVAIVMVAGTFALMALVVEILDGTFTRRNRQ